MAYQVKTTAKGNAGNTAGPVRTPPPDEISHVRGPTLAGYGQNGGPNNPSSVPPGKRVLSPLAANLESSVDDGGALSRVISEGTARVDSSITGQLRDIAAKNVPQNRDTHGAAPGPKVPATLGASNGQPVRKPGA